MTQSSSNGNLVNSFLAENIMNDLSIFLNQPRQSLTADEEKALARKIIKAREDLWASLLSYSSYTNSVIDFSLKHSVKERVLKRFGKNTIKKCEFAFKNIRSNSLDCKNKEAFESDCIEVGKHFSYIDISNEIAIQVVREFESKSPFGKRPNSANKKLEAHVKEINFLLKSLLRSKEKFWNCNIGWAIKRSKRWYTKASNHHYYKDLVQESLLGVMKAVERFDPEKGFRFSTYSKWWIDFSIRRFVENNGRTIRLPVKTNSDLTKIRKATKSIEQRGKDATIDMISKEIGFSKQRIEDMSKIIDARPASMEKPLWNSFGEETFGSAIGSAIGSAMQDDTLPDIEEMAIHQNQFDHVAKAMKTLNPLEREIIKRRFSLGKYSEEETLKNIGKDYGRSRERIRQVQKVAMQKLRDYMSEQGVVA